MALPQELADQAYRMAELIRSRRSDISLNVNYYKGAEGKMRFASEEFKSYFQKRFAGFSDNWCQPVAQSPIERMRYLGFRLPGAREADPDLTALARRNNFERVLPEALLMMTVAKRSFLLVSPSPQGARVTGEHPDSACVLYDAQTRQRVAGMVMWEDDTHEYAQWQNARLVVNLQREKGMVDAGDRRVAPDTEWDLREVNDRAVVANPLGAVGLVELRNQMLMDDEPISDIAGVRAMQDAINLIWAYLLNGLDYASLPGRVVTGGEMPMEPVLNEQGQKVGERPIDLDKLIKDRIAWLGPNTSIAEWTAAQLDVYSNVVEHAVEHIAAQTRTPPHYLIASSSNTPATGYELAEAGLVSKTRERISYADPEIREVNRLAMLAEGQKEKAAAVANGENVWAKPQYRTEEQLMDGLVKMRAAGFPIRYIIEEYGLGPDEVDRVMEMIRDEQMDPFLAAGLNETTDGARAVSPAAG